MTTFYELTSEQQKYVTRKIFVFEEGKQPFYPQYIIAIVDTDRKEYMVHFMQKGYSSIIYTFTAKGVKANVASVAETNNIIQKLLSTRHTSERLPYMDSSTFRRMKELIEKYT